ncbi:transglutaminase-like cysteine peptidase [Histidinibacterium aquaticum]|uniref:Transglutaminase-like cysteine peptidase n=1 Tax=Histidinibacterium aquaticum TaxID=2613962 RepID=A0A5J5GC49_9RHOB|nr:transglutaminase-like cysteine peptidase [Histidinibacterium aquaticum]KAA9005601.1 transglutaminase-like cysteine peptidase [Histidinibacterium aquaticum]
MACRTAFRAFCLAALMGVSATGGPAREVRCGPLTLALWRVEGQPSQYADFCEREPAACALSGSPVLDWDSAHSALERVNREVNDEITLVPDEPGETSEECWQFPVNGMGDCEDFALEKRRRLVAEGLPSAALTMAIVHHEVQVFPHAVLLAETTRGTWVLDNLSDDILCWDAVPYRYERRERPDGMWVRYAIR